METNETKLDKTQWIQFYALMFGAFVAIEAMVFQAPAIPAIALYFDIPTHLSGFIVLSFYIMSASLYPITGRLADQYGRRKILLVGMVIFTVSEVAAALSPTFSFLLAARALQGVAVACVFPIVIAYIGVIFPPEKRGTASGIFNFFQACASMSGAAIAGILISKFGWPIIYWVSGALGALGFIVIFLFVKESKGEGKGALDLPGIILVFIATASLLSVSTLVETFGIDSLYTLATIGIGILAAVSLWFVQNRTTNPLLELGLLKNRLYALVAVIYLLNVAAMQLYIYSMNFFLSLRPGGEVTESGFFFMFIYGASAVGGLIAGKLCDKYNNKILLLITLAIPTIALFINSQIDSGTPFSTIATIAAFFGIGSAIPIHIKLALTVIPAPKYGAGSALLAFIRDFGAPLGSVTGIVLYSSFNQNFTLSSLLNQAKEVGVNSNLMDSVEKAGTSSGKIISNGLADELQSLGINFKDLMLTATEHGATLSIQNLSLVTAGFFIILILLSIFIPKKMAEAKPRTDSTSETNAS